jgi:alkaline phosphatase D
LTLVVGRRASWTIRSARRRCFRRAASAEQGENLAPCFGLQFFGRVDIDGRSGIMTVTLKDVDDRDLWSVDIEPRPDARHAPILAQHS